MLSNPPILINVYHSYHYQGYLVHVIITASDDMSLLGLIAAGVPVGPIVFTQPFKHLLETYGWRFLLRVLSVPLFVVVLLGAIVFVSEMKDPGMGAEKSALHQCKRLLKMPAFNVWLVGIFLARLGADIMPIHQVCLIMHIQTVAKWQEQQYQVTLSLDKLVDM